MSQITDEVCKVRLVSVDTFHGMDHYLLVHIKGIGEKQIYLTDHEYKAAKSFYRG